MAVYPTQGLDAKAVERTWELFLDLREQGSAVLLVSEDLDEIMAVSDRIAVMSGGVIRGMFEGAAVKREEIGLMIAAGSSKFT